MAFEPFQWALRKRTRKNAPSLLPGSLYSVQDSEGWFRLAKVLVVSPDAVHIHLYQIRSQTRLAVADLEEANLTLCSVLDSCGYVIGHLPLSRSSFDRWQPIFLKNGEVAADELISYHLWKKAKGGLL